MRVPLAKVYRAFPELDGYSDEQCRRFLRVARKTMRRRWLHRGLIALIVLVSLVLSGLAAALVLHLAPAMWDPLAPWRTRGGVLCFLALLVLVAAPPLTWLLATDFFLRRRLKGALRSKGRCPQCRYSLVGLPLGPRGMVTCPECAYECEVDPSLAVLARRGGSGEGERGAAVVEPVEEAFLSPRVDRFVRRAAVVLGVLVFVGGPLAMLGYEIFLRRQAALARSERPGVEGLMSLVESVQPSGAMRGEPDAWDALLDAVSVREAIDAEYLGENEHYTERGSLIHPDFTLLYYTPRPGERGMTEDEIEISRDLASGLLRRYREDGLFDVMRGVVERPRAVRRVAVGADDPLFGMMLWELSDARVLARINRARMHLAWEAGDRGEFLEALECSLALARIVSKQGSLIDWLTAAGIEGLARTAVRHVLDHDPDAELLEGIERALDRYPLMPISHAVEGERIIALDTVAGMFGDVSRVRFGRFSPRYHAAVEVFTGGGTMLLPLGTYRANRDAFNRFFDEALALIEQEPHVRSTAVFELVADIPDLVLAQMLMPALDHAVTYGADLVELERRGTRVLLALERRRLVHGDYPVALDELVPGFLDELPLDPWSGEPLRYARVDPETDLQGRSFLLYSVGAGGEDNGGRTPESAGDRRRVINPLRRDLAGYDYVINHADF